MRIYLDVSCLNRPFDDQTQERIRLESEATVLIIDRIDRGDWTQVVSDAVLLEIAAAPDVDRRNRVYQLLPETFDSISLTDRVVQRARKLVSQGVKNADALHVAAAEAGRADVLLTCDDRLVRWGQRRHDSIRIEIANPVVWLGDMQNAQDS